MKNVVLIIGLVSLVQGEKCDWNENAARVLQVTLGADWGYGYDSLLIDLQRWGQSPYVLIDSLGASVQNRGLWEMSITDPATSNSLKRRVYIHARTHPGEVQSFWVTNAIIGFLISDEPYAAFIRQQCVFHIIPMFNPDGVELGYPRENANGVDIESNWYTDPNEPEVIILRNRFIELMATESPVEIALNMHSSYRCTRYFVYHDSQGTSNDYALLEQQFITGVQTYFPDGIEDWNYFVSWTGGTPLLYPESWWWLNYREDVLALTYEDMNCIEAGQYNMTANALVHGIGDYLDLAYVGVNIANVLPERVSLFQNYPNPFNPITRLNYVLHEKAYVSLGIYDLLGREIKILVSQDEGPGYKSINWDGTNIFGQPVGSGIYMYTIQVGNYVKTRKMILMR